MADGLVAEIRTYCAHTAQLRKALSNTRFAFTDLNSARCFIGDQPITGEMSYFEEEEIETVSNRPPCFVIFGQTSRAKVAVVNHLFQCEVLPTTLPDSTRPWRTILFRHGVKNRFTRMDEDFIVVHASHKAKSWVTLPMSEIEIDEDIERLEKSEFCSYTSAVDAQFKHRLLEAGARVTLAGGDGLGFNEQIFKYCVRNVMPVFIYAISTCTFNVQELEWLKFMRLKAPDISVFFVRIPPLPLAASLSPIPNSNLIGIEVTATKDLSAALANNSNHSSVIDSHLPAQCFPCSGNVSGQEVESSSDIHNVNRYDERASVIDSQVLQRLNSATYVGSLALLEQLLNLGFQCNIRDGGSVETLKMVSTTSFDTDSGSYSADNELLESFDGFWDVTFFVHDVLQRRLVTAVALANLIHVRCLEMMIAKAHDMQRDVMLTPTKLKFAKMKEDELYNSLMKVTRTKQEEIKILILETIEGMQEELLNEASEYQFKGIFIPESEIITSANDLKICTTQIQELVLSHLNSAIADKLAKSIDVLQDSCSGILTRTLKALEQKDSEVGESLRASKALSEILNSAYHVEITVFTGASFVKSVIERMKQVISSNYLSQLMQAVLWRTSPRINADWKRKVATNMLATLSDVKCQRLAYHISAQIQERLKRSHQMFGTSLKQLELRHTDRLGRTIEQRDKVAKRYAPRVARLALESRSLKDLIAYGKPRLGQEVGRGQYGVVYSCDSWGGCGPCAVKTVVPPDDKHWNDLAMEFYYYKNVPDHDRIVSLRGSIIDYTYSGSGNPAALLVMDRLKWDLYTAIDQKLDWLSRLQVAIDVVEGIRFLHNQGLVHRDVKLKNVLLDEQNRGKLTDLGFCKPEAMMSGSVVGTPLHMAPELFSGKYDHSVDLYAFGILFWYVCAGTVRLPRSFEVCPSKEMLWTHVRSGLRPEKLNCFDEDCWEIMTSCWHGDADCRPLVGEVEMLLRLIHSRYAAEKSENVPLKSSTMETDASQTDSDDSDVDTVM